MRTERAVYTTAVERRALRSRKGRAVLAAGLILGVTFGTAAWAQTTFEAPAVFTAATLAPPNLLTGPGFTVDSQVPVETFLYRFTIRANVGLFEAHGLAVLLIRVQEVRALQNLQDTSGTAEFAQAVEQAGARPIMSAVNMLTHPMDTITACRAASSGCSGASDWAWRALAAPPVTPINRQSSRRANPGRGPGLRGGAAEAGEGARGGSVHGQRGPPQEAG